MSSPPSTEGARPYGVQDSSFQAAGGEPGIRALVNDFYDLMESDPRFRTIHEMHQAEQTVRRDKLVLFLCGWMGGPRLFQQKYGSINIPAVHHHLAVGEREKRQWLACMEEAIAHQPYADDFKGYLLYQLSLPAEVIRQRCAPQVGVGSAATPGSKK